MTQIFDVAVIGAGINGLSTAYHLSNVSNLKILLIQQFNIAHTEGSSHSNTRIIRSAYQNEIYLKLAQESKNVSWPALQKHLNQSFIANNLYFLFGQGKQWQQYKKITQKINLPTLKIISGQQAEKINPTLKLKQFKELIVDYNAGIIYAKKTIQQLAKFVKKHASVFQNTQVTQIKQFQDYILIKTANNKKQFKTKKLVITAGRWVPNLVPAIADILKVNLQTIVYLDFQDDIQNYKIGKYGSFSWFQSNNPYTYYSLPAFQNDCVKFGIHDNTYIGQNLSQQQKLQNMKSVYQKLYKKKLRSIQKIQKCYYTSTKTQQFIIDFIDPKNRILVTSTCSGHSFKFGPLTGKILAQLIQYGETSVKIFEENRLMFSIYYHKGVNLL